MYITTGSITGNHTLYIHVHVYELKISLLVSIAIFHEFLMSLVSTLPLSLSLSPSLPHSLPHLFNHLLIIISSSVFVECGQWNTGVQLLECCTEVIPILGRDVLALVEDVIRHSPSETQHLLSIIKSFSSEQTRQLSREVCLRVCVCLCPSVTVSTCSCVCLCIYLWYVIIYRNSGKFRTIKIFV